MILVGMNGLHLAQGSHGLPVQTWVLFSSIAAVTGPAGSSNYAAANASLDALAHALHSQGKLHLLYPSK